MKPKKDWSHISPQLKRLCKIHHRTPYGICDCQMPNALLRHSGQHVCDDCFAMRKDRADNKSHFFGVCGSNIHRVTGKRVDMHILNEHATIGLTKYK